MASNLSTTHAEEENDQVLGAKICSLLLANHQYWERESEAIY